jgi:hypothetical protein
MAKEAVKIVLGKENEYVERLLINKLFGVSKNYSFTPLSELVPPQHRETLKKELNVDTRITQKKAINALVKSKSSSDDSNKDTNTDKKDENNDTTKEEKANEPTKPTTQHVIVDVGGMITNLPDNVEIVNGTVDVSDNQAISSWIVNTILEEKLNYREVQEKAERRKTLYGLLATVLPIITPVITGVIQYYLTKYIYSSE